FGLLCLSILQLTDSKPVRDAVRAEDRAIFADELRAELTVAAKADGTLHVAFHRQENVFGKHSALLQLKYGVSHHHLGAADHRCRVARIKRCALNQRGDIAYVPKP